MSNPLLKSLSLLDTSGYVIIAVILILLGSAIILTLTIRARYAALERELRRHPNDGRTMFDAKVLRSIAADAENAFASQGRDINSQAIIEQNFETELRPLLIGERFIKSSTGLLIILGLVGTFYGLTLSIGRLVGLISGEGAATTEITENLMQGLTQALSGMSVAFSCSLFGIVSAIIMTLVGVFASVGDRRTALMVQIEAFLDNELGRNYAQAGGGPAVAGGIGGVPQLERLVVGFGDSVAQLQQSVAAFDGALQTFAMNTRDFREFNLHLKDNVQRMSLSFGDFSEALKQQVGALKGRH